MTTTVLSPLAAAAAGNRQGLAFGPDQDNLVGVQLQNDGGVLYLAAYVEQNGTRTAIGSKVALSSVAAPAQITGIRLVLTPNTAAGTVGAAYQVSTAGGPGTLTSLGTSPVLTDRQYFFARSAAGSVYTSSGAGASFTGKFDDFAITSP